MDKQIIGRKDKVDFPEFGLTNLDVKIDTGAFGCAFHCHHMEIIDRGGETLLRFQVLDPEHPEFDDQYFYAHDFGMKQVKSSSGIAEERYAINTQMVIFGRTFEVEFSLTDRKDMKTPVLLGRTFIKDRFIVDVAEKNVSYKQKKNK